jgi:hypothetical protein
MFVTLAWLRSVAGGRLEYSLAGHPPILYYHSPYHWSTLLRRSAVECSGPSRARWKRAKSMQVTDIWVAEVIGDCVRPHGRVAQNLSVL